VIQLYYIQAEGQIIAQKKGKISVSETSQRQRADESLFCDLPDEVEFVKR